MLARPKGLGSSVWTQGSWVLPCSQPTRPEAFGSCSAVRPRLLGLRPDPSNFIIIIIKFEKQILLLKKNHRLDLKGIIGIPIILIIKFEKKIITIEEKP